jgi:hypothetical protein
MPAHWVHDGIADDLAEYAISLGFRARREVFLRDGGGRRYGGPWDGTHQNGYADLIIDNQAGYPLFLVEVESQHITHRTWASCKAAQAHGYCRVLPSATQGWVVAPSFDCRTHPWRGIRMATVAGFKRLLAQMAEPTASEAS